jgi:CheY-like chemotaxis protein
MRELLFVSANSHFGETIRSILIRVNTNVTIASSKDSVQRFAERSYDFVMIDAIIGKHKAVDIFDTLNVYPHFKNSEVWLMGEKNLNKLTRRELMKNINATKYLMHPFSPLEVLESISKPKRLIHSSYNINSLRLVSQIWATKSSMIVQASKLKIILMKGSVVSHSNLDILKDLLLFESITPKKLNSERSGGNWTNTGKKLFEIAAEKPDNNWLYKNSQYSPISNISRTTLEVLITETSMSYIKSSTQLSKIPLDGQIDIYSLWKMGFVQLKIIEKKNLSKEQKVMKAFDVRNLLEAEIQRCDNAPASKVLGLASGAGVIEVVGLAQRMEDRYLQIKHDFQTHKDIVSLAEQMLIIVRGAADTLSGGGYIDQDSLPEHEKLFQYGVRQIESGNWQIAERALTKANQMCIEDARILAAKGWAEFNNPDKEELRRQKDGMESLLLAIHFDKDNIDSLVYITKAYIALSDYENALGPIKRASTLTPDPKVQELRSMVEKQMA